MLFLAIEFVMICYSSDRKLIHTPNILCTSTLLRFCSGDALPETCATQPKRLKCHLFCVAVTDAQRAAILSLLSLYLTAHTSIIAILDKTKFKSPYDEIKLSGCKKIKRQGAQKHQKA